MNMLLACESETNIQTPKQEQDVRILEPWRREDASGLGCKTYRG